jgi:uncharacterized protein (DUF58 family)
VLLSEGERMSHPWHIVNRGKQTAGLVQAETAAGVLFRLGTLAADTETRVVPSLVFQKRGVYAYGQVQLSSVYPFGLVKAARRLDLPGEVVVGPAVYPAPAPRAAGYDVMLGGKFKGHRRSTAGTYFAGVRPFQDGDPLKQVHWKSSAKGLGLMVKTFDEELSGRISCLVDCGQPEGDVTLDDCLRAAASLLFAGLGAGHHVELIGLDRLEPLLVPPFSDGQEILDMLARITPAPGTLNTQQLQRALDRISKRSAICLVLTGFNPAVAATIEQLQNNHRHVSLYLPAGCKSPENLAGVPVFAYADRGLT